MTYKQIILQLLEDESKRRFKSYELLKASTKYGWLGTSGDRFEVIEDRKRAMKNDPENFLRESNAIEGVYDEDSLQQALYAWDYLINQDEMSPSVCLKTHKILMLHQPLLPNERGYFRHQPVYIGGKEAIKHREIRPRMESWCAAMNSTNPTHDWKTLHVLYEEIHPFVDGNGRTGRMFMNWHRVKILGLPLLVVWEKERQSYYEWFK